MIIPYPVASTTLTADGRETSVDLRSCLVVFPPSGDRTECAVIPRSGPQRLIDPSYHPRTLNYIQKHFIIMGQGCWVNPEAVTLLRLRENQISVHFEKVRMDIPILKNMAEILRDFPLAAVNETTFTALSAFHHFQADSLSLLGQNQGIFPVGAREMRSVLDHLSALGWLRHRDGSLTNPRQILYIDGRGHLVFHEPRDQFVWETPINRSHLTPVALAHLDTAPLTSISGGWRINASKITGICIPQNGGSGSIWVGSISIVLNQSDVLILQRAMCLP